MCLPLGLGYEITPTDELLSFLEAIKGVDLSKYMVRKETRGRKGHNRIDLLRAELFAYMKLGHPTLRELEYQCRRNLDFMFLTKELGSLTVVSNFSLTKSLKTLIISMLLSFFIVKFVKIIVLIRANVCYNGHRR